ncbi:MAG: two-component regulator propeller domain-containing protein [Candidatus Acidiferrum sp.]
MRNSNTFLDVSRKWQWLRRSLVVGFAIVCCASLAQALDPNRLLSQYIREHWGSEKGFTGGSVTALAQTADGYLWIGTEKGLIRFDGLSFRLFQQATPTTFPIGAVQQLVADAEGNLWILLKSTKILRYHDGKFDLGREEAEFGLTSVIKRTDGSVLLSSLALGPLTYRAARFEVVSPPAESANPASSVTNDELSSRLSWATGVVPHRFAEPNSAVTSMAEYSDGTLWLGTRDKGLFLMRQGKVSSVAGVPPETKINCLLVSPNGELWIGTDRGLLRWNGTKITAEGVAASLAHVQVLSAIRDRDSNIWFGTAKGLIRLSPEGVALDTANPRSSGPVNALFEDREGNIWSGGPQGIDRLRDSAFITYSVSGLTSESGGPVYVDQAGRVWFAPYEGGLQWLAGEKNGDVTTAGLAQDVVYSIAGDEGDLWVGRQQGGLTRLRFSNGSLSARTYTQADGLAQNSVYAVYESRDGTVWAGTLSGGVSQYKDGRFKTYTTADGMSSNTVTAIAETADGTMWFATPNGISEFDKGRWRVLRVSDGLPEDSVNCLSPDLSGVLWIGTASGLAFLRSGRLQTPVGLPTSLHEQILGIAEDRNGWLWISTSSHVLRLEREKLLGGTLTDADIREYGLEDGLKGTEGVKRFQSVIADKKGNIWFSMNRGLSVVDPTRATPDSAPALVHIDGVTVDGNKIDIHDSLRLTGPHRTITFSYKALSLSVPERVRYKYKLEGFDEGWSNPIPAREAIYNNLNSGSYRFRLLASSSEGAWNSGESDVAFQIAPQYWQTWWFRLTAALVVALIILLIFRLRMRQLAAQLNMRFEERLSERTRIAQELHDTLLQGFMSASMHLHVADDCLPADSPAKPLVTRTLQLMTRVIEEGRNTVRGLRSSDAGQQNLEEAFTRLQQELAPSGHAEFRVLIEGTPRPLRPVIRDEIYSIGREALTNACRHSKATEIIVEIEYSGNQLNVLVRDNGIGINPDVLRSGRDGHWGLPGMRERADRIGARLRLLSRAAAGTEVELSIPSRIAFEVQPSGGAKHWFSRLYSKKSEEAKSETVKTGQ